MYLDYTPDETRFLNDLLPYAYPDEPVLLVDDEDEDSDPDDDEAA